jgi:hypothetical protein
MFQISREVSARILRKIGVSSTTVASHAAVHDRF